MSPCTICYASARGAFAAANSIRPSDGLTAILNGRLKHLQVVGIALSPEFVFAAKPGDPIPDDSRYGLMWIGRTALAAAFDMEGAFNDIVAMLAPGANETSVRDAIDRRLEPNGGLIAHGRRDQASHRVLADEIAQQGVMATTMPAVFLAVAVFLLHAMLGRLVGAQREQVAALKALGYANRAIAWHYGKFALAVVSAGAVLGLALDIWLGGVMVQNYTRFFRFPQLEFHVATWVPLLAPAEAMRPPAPQAYQQGMLERLPGVRHMAARRLMILRRMTDRSVRSMLTIAGIALAAPIIMMSLF